MITLTEHDYHALGIDTTAVPGTEHLVDLDGTMHTKHDKKTKDIVLLPTPSADPEDPLNWSPRRKALHMVGLATYCLFIGTAFAAINSVLPQLLESTDLTLNELNNGTGYLFLCFGWGCIFWQPMALQFGKRPIYLLSLLGSCAVQFWAPYATTSGQWIAKNCIQGFFGAPFESLCEISITDIFFAHERGRYLGMYVLFANSSASIAPILAGFIADGMGWKWVLWWPAISLAFGAVVVFLILEETNYDRKQAPTSEPHTQIQIHSTQKSVDVAGDNAEKSAGATTTFEPEVEPALVVEYNKKPYWKRLSLLDKSRPNKLWVMCIRPFQLLSLPIIVYCGFANGIAVVWSTVALGVSSVILSSPPYNFSATNNGLLNIASLLGIIVAMARKRNGIAQAEFRLWLCIFPAIGVPFALILFGVGATHHVHCLAFACGLLFIIMMVWGKDFRQQSRVRYWRYAAQRKIEK
ncbi:hypothetical protein LTR84_008265 [Exophiala bonariae]|uniref:Major facilitator superfamily (MFS) profile domain-containing protein n=1 Tax=Exophiala bonariae TaxID=1690606 RepID=A0AAV9MXW6_9EURO|nr:hypothetical protein LTR84_008265 [Exophiala bonariae]